MATDDVGQIIAELEKKAREAYQRWRAVAAMEVKARRAYHRAQALLLAAKMASKPKN